MKNLIVLIAIMVFNGSLFAQTGTIKLTVTGVNPKSGDMIRIAVYDKEGFLKEVKEQKSIKSIGDTAYVEFESIPIGKYAIAVFQDINLDGELNTNFYGKPTEPNGFSNNKKGKYGPPDFEEVSFVVFEDKSTALIIRLE